MVKPFSSLLLSLLLPPELLLSAGEHSPVEGLRAAHRCRGLEDRRGGQSPSGLEQGSVPLQDACSFPSQGAGKFRKLSLSSRRRKALSQGTANFCCSSERGEDCPGKGERSQQSPGMCLAPSGRDNATKPPGPCGSGRRSLEREGSFRKAARIRGFAYGRRNAGRSQIAQI